jgi:hypothetical protein
MKMVDGPLALSALLVALAMTGVALLRRKDAGAFGLGMMASGLVVWSATLLAANQLPIRVSAAVVSLAAPTISCGSLQLSRVFANRGRPDKWWLLALISAAPFVVQVLAWAVGGATLWGPNLLPLAAASPVEGVGSRALLLCLLAISVASCLALLPGTITAKWWQHARPGRSWRHSGTVVV